MRKVWLLDVNVLLGWLWPKHETHKAASTWMDNHRNEPWATCPITEIGFLRIVTNRSFSPHAPAWSEAVRMLRKHTEGNALHCFWQDSLTLAEMDRQFGSGIKGPNQITDAYLLAVAVKNDGRLVTFDNRIRALAPPGSREHTMVEFLRP